MDLIFHILTFLSLLVLSQTMHSIKLLKVTTGVSEAHLHQAYKPCVIGAIPSQTYAYVVSLRTLALFVCERSLLSTVMELLQ